MAFGSALGRLRRKPPAELRRILGRRGVIWLQETAKRWNATRPLARAAGAWYRFPSRGMHLVGVTGTNGKGSVGHLIWAALDELGVPAGFVGTNGVRYPGHDSFLGLTTPPSIELNGILSRMRRAGVRICIMEVSSHALVENRVWGLEFATAIFTRLAPDHLDYHGSMAAYARAKDGLFRMLGKGGLAIVNGDDSWADHMAGAARSGRVVRYFLDDEGDPRSPVSDGEDSCGPGRLPFRILSDTLDGLVVEIDGHEIRSHAVGRFHGYNLAAAYAALRELGTPAERCAEVLGRVPTLAGRLERVLLPGRGDNALIPHVFVDRGQNPDSLRSILGVLRQTAGRGVKVTCMMSGVGDSSDDRLREMGKVASELADRVIITNGKVKLDDPGRLMAGIESGLLPGTVYQIIPDRRTAVAAAVRGAGTNAVVVLAGLGEGREMKVGGASVWICDAEMAAEALAGPAAPDEERRRVTPSQ